MNPRWLWILLVSFVLAGCGGGDFAPAEPPQAVAKALRDHANTAPPRSPLEAAEELMDFGERAFPGYFTEHRPTERSSPFVYRFYPQTGLYLGVALEESSSYALNGVYVQGGEFGAAPVFLGLVSTFDATKGVFIGNSITYSPANPAVGWDHGSGMAASSAATDYAHIVADALHLWAPSYINFAALERDPAGNMARIAELTAGIDHLTAVTIQLGDNVAPDRLADFQPAYEALLDAASRGRTLVCVGTWWELWAKETMIKQACEARGGTYVFIGDIRYDPGNRDPFDGPQYADPSIQDHPHDWSMARIAERVLAAHRKE